MGLYITPDDGDYEWVTDFEHLDYFSMLAFKATRSGFDDKMPAIGFTLKYDEDSDQNFVRRNGTMITSLKEGYTFDMDFWAESYDSANNDWYG